MPKASDQDTRARLLAAAQADIAELGWGAVRTRGVAERAGVNSGLVHYHFGSIEALKVEAAAAAVSAMAGGVMAGVLAEEHLSGALRAIGRSLAATPSDSLEWRVLVEAMVETPRVPEVGEMTARLLDAYRAVMVQRLDRAVAAGELAAGSDTDALAMALLAMLDGVALYRTFIPGLDPERSIAAIAALFECEEHE